LRMLDIGGLRAPDRELANLSGMTHLTVLELIAYNKNHLRDLSIVRNLPKLTFLNINGTAVSDITPLEGLSELVTLDLGYAPITNFAPVERLPKLSRLSVAWPRGDLSAIKRRRDVTVSDQNDRRFIAYLEFQQMMQDAAGFSFDCDKTLP
jgi:internalin A